MFAKAGDYHISPGALGAEEADGGWFGRGGSGSPHGGADLV